MVALKQLHAHLADQGEAHQRFLVEVDLLSQLDHPSILPVLDCDLEAEAPWFTAHFCEQGSIADRVVRSVVPTFDLVELALEVLDALAYIHEQGIVHRDVKPENILIDEAGLARLADFGIARSPLRAGTMVGDRLGTPSFCAPEQLEDPQLATERSDLYGVGSTLYVCQQRKTGLPLLIERQRESCIQGLPPLLRPVVRKATALDPAERYASANEMAYDLADVLDAL